METHHKMLKITFKKIIIFATVATAIVALIIAVKNTGKHSLVLRGSSGYEIIVNSHIKNIAADKHHTKITAYAKYIEEYNGNNIIYFLINNISGSSIKNIIIPVEMSNNGSIIHIEYPAGIENDKTLYSLFQYIFQTISPVYNSSINEWEDILYTNNGFIKYHYMQNGKNIKKVKNLIEEYNVNVNIELSDISLTLSNSFWLENASSNEIVTIKASGLANSEVTNTIKLVQIPFDNNLEKYFNKPYSKLLAEYKENKKTLFDTNRNYIAKYIPIDNKSMAALLADFNEKFNAMNDDSNKSYFAMLKLLQNNPQLLASIPKKIKEIGESNDVAARMLIGILEKIGTADAQNTLTIIMKDKEIITANRIRAIVALNGVSNPSDHTIDSLIQLSSIRSSDENNFIADTSVLALGSAGSKLLGKTDKYEDVRNYFDTTLAGSDETTYNTLLGIGNTSDEYFYNKVTPYLTSPNEYNREAAVFAAASTNFNEFIQGAESFLSNESSAGVRSKVYDAFTESMRPTAQMTNIVKENFKQESSVVQNSMLNYLKRNSKQPEAEKFLQELMTSSNISAQEKVNIRHILGSK